MKDISIESVQNLSYDVMDNIKLQWPLEALIQIITFHWDKVEDQEMFYK